MANFYLVSDASFDLTQSLAPVPEPQSWRMLVAGGLVAALRLRRRAAHKLG